MTPCFIATPALFQPHTRRLPHLTPRRHRAPQLSAASDYTTVCIVPTGVGARIGGYAGDALPSARLLASVSDTLITHPNVLNGASLYWPVPTAHYVEGWALDAFAQGTIALSPHRQNRIGLVIDSALSTPERIRHLQVAEGARATLGIGVTDYTITDAPLGVALSAGTGGASWGGIARPDSLLRASKTLLDIGCDALAIVARFPDDDDEALAEYRAGSGVDAVAGAEAVISRLVARELCVPCAHAPALATLEADPDVSPKSAAEELGYTFLSCVLVGLSRAPRVISCGEGRRKGAIYAEDVDAVVLPANCFGGAAAMSLAARKDVLVVAVRENYTVMNVSPDCIGLPGDRVRFVANYAEAAGVIAAHKAGIDLDAITSNVPRIRRIEHQLAAKAVMSS